MRSNALIRRLFAKPVAPLLAAALMSACAVAQPVSDEAFQQAFNRFKQAVGGQTDAVDGAADAFAKLLAEQPGDPVLMAYAGASTSLRARTTVMPWKKLGYAEDGLAQIDKALTVAASLPNLPAHRGTAGVLELKFVAATSMLAVPPFLNRAQRGTKLLNEVLDNPAFPSAPPAFRAEVLLRAADLALENKQSPQARRYLNDAVALNTPQSEVAKTKLREVAP